MKNIVCQFGLLLYKFTWKLPALHARPLSSHRKIGGTISLKLPIFEEEHLVWLVILYIEYFALPAWPLSPQKKMGGHGLAKLTDFQRRRFGLVGLFIWTFSTLRARPLSSRRKMGGRFCENWRFSKHAIEFGWPFYVNIFRPARAAFIVSNNLIIFTKRIVLK